MYFVHHFLIILQTAIKTLEKNTIESPEVFKVMFTLRQQLLSRKEKMFYEVLLNRHCLSFRQNTKNSLNWKPQEFTQEPLSI